MSKKNQAINPAKEGIAERILSTLADHKRTKAWLAEEIGISKQMLNYWLRSANQIKYVDQISQALNLNPLWLLHKEEPRCKKFEGRVPYPSSRKTSSLRWGI